MKESRAGGKNLRKDKKALYNGRRKTESLSPDNQARLSNTQSQRRSAAATAQHLSSTQSQRLSSTQSQRLSSTQSQRLSSTQSQKTTATQTQAKLSLADRTVARATEASRKRFIHIAFAAVVALFIISVAVVLKFASEEKSYNAYYQQAQQAYEAADYETSLVYLRKALSINENEESLLLMADCYMHCGKMEKALEVLRTLDVTDSEIAAKISTIEKARQAAISAEKVVIAGEKYPADARNLVLDGRGLGNDAVEEISRLYTLANLSVSDNEISDLSPLSALGGLTMLNLSNNNISDLSPLSGLGVLRTLYLDGNPIESFEPLYSLSSLSTLSIRNVPISEQQLTALSQALPDCAIHCETEEKAVAEISFGGVSFSSQVTEIDLSNLGITDISVLSSCKNLKTLNLSGNYISDISPLMDIPGLEWLNISGNQVIDLRPLMGISSLRVINAENNNIDSIVALGSLTDLTELYLSGNPIRDFSTIGSLQKLSTLGLESTGLDDAGLAYARDIASLRILMLKNNPLLTGNAVDEFKNNNQKCRVYHDEDMVYVIELGGKEFREDAIVIDAPYMDLTDISALSGFDKAERVNLCGNRITNIYCFQWMTSVKELNLSGNGLMDITALQHLVNLEKLDLSGNNISSLTPLYLLPNLKEVHLGGNPIKADYVQELQSYQPDLIIHVE